MMFPRTMDMETLPRVLSGLSTYAWHNAWSHVDSEYRARVCACNHNRDHYEEQA